jgi:alpha-galactosidase
MTRLFTSGVLSIAAMLACSASLAAEQQQFHSWAPRPPMGWNSWDNFATTITEEQTKAQADYMAKHLKEFGWQYIVVDIQWYEPGAKSHAYRPDAILTMDEYGRLLPALNRFPSSADAAGFTKLAEYIHAKGLKFGIHLMRGIPRQAVDKNLRVKGTKVRAQDIANKNSICPWNPDMYGVDMSKPGAQEYYNSVFELIASWGVDYVKVDDISRPYHDHQAEIEAIRKAIDLTGRPIVLSLSPGETAITAAEHVKHHANLWRISDDFWDTWPVLHEQFARLERWNPHRAKGAWPDADMLPFGVIDLGTRTSRFTKDEHYTVMSLWSIARSPLMHGGDMTRMDPFTLSVLTNPEVLAVNQDSEGNRMLFNRDDLIGWVADVPNSRAKYLALFNARDQVSLKPERATYRSEVFSRTARPQPQTIDIDIRGAARLVLVIDGGEDGTSGDHGVWAEPTLIDAKGRAHTLLDQSWLRASGGWGQVSTQKAPSGKPISVQGKQGITGIAAHAKSIVEYDLPANIERFRARIALDDAVLEQKDGGTLRFLVFAAPPGGTLNEQGLPIPVRFSDLGLAERVRVRDLWERKDLGTFDQEFSPTVNWHGARVFRLSPETE